MPGLSVLQTYLPKPESGFCCARKTPEEIELRNRSRKIDRDIRNDQKIRQRQVKLLLLGAGESGKSTFLKQMKIIHRIEFDADQIREYRQIIYQNIIKGIRVLVDAANKLGVPFEKPENRVYGQQMLLFDNMAGVDQNNFGDYKNIVLSLWTDSGIRETFDRRSQFQLTDSIEYFYTNLDRIATPNYTPSTQDILYCRKTTKGIIEFPLIIEGVPFLFVDVGGQRTQRQKWMQCFDSVTAILFLASTSEYDQVLVEDSKTNRLEEARNIFDAIVNNRIFKSIAFILFLNKMDLLQDKVERKKVDISKYFEEEWSEVEKIRRFVPKFGGDPRSLADVKSFILYLFLVKQRNNTEPIFHHFTTAVDTRNIEYVFNAVKQTVLRDNLKRLMLQ